MAWVEINNSERNTECPDSKGIKTSSRRALEWSGEILNALIQKGLRPHQSVGEGLVVGNTECPDSKGIKTLNFAFVRPDVKY